MVRVVLDALTPSIIRLLESTYWGAYGFSAVIGGLIVFASIAVGSLLGLDATYIGLGSAASIISAGVIEMWVGRSKEPKVR